MLQVSMGGGNRLPSADSLSRFVSYAFFSLKLHFFKEYFRGIVLKNVLYSFTIVATPIHSMGIVKSN